MKRVYIFILVFLMNIAAVWGQANGTQIAETDSTLIMQNSKVRIEKWHCLVPEPYYSHL